MDEAYENLANAIIVQAAEDWKKAYKYLRKHARSRSKTVKENMVRTERIKIECENFFRSAWFKTLTNADGEAIFSRLQKEAEEEYEQRNASKVNH